MWKTFVGYPLVIATGLAIGSGEWTLPVFLSGVTIGLLCAALFELITWVLIKRRQ